MSDNGLVMMMINDNDRDRRLSLPINSRTFQALVLSSLLSAAERHGPYVPKTSLKVSTWSAGVRDSRHQMVGPRPQCWSYKPDWFTAGQGTCSNQIKSNLFNNKGLEASYKLLKHSIRYV